MTTFKEEFLEEFLGTAVERYRILLRKEAGCPKPWTKDPVLRDFFFCNLFRQSDKCSQWIINRILPYNRWDLLILYRFISTYDTFLRMEQANVNLESLKEAHVFLEYLKGEKIPIFSGCFIRNTRIPNGWTEAYNVPFILIREIKKVGGMEGTIQEQSLETMVRYLSKFPGTAGFMGYEYACDFAYTKWFNPTDIDTWANMGPGAKRGMSLLLYGNAHHPIHSTEWLAYAKELLPILQNRMKQEGFVQDVHMREIEHWLCEYQKYRKYSNFLHGGDKIKHRKYNGRSDV